MPERLDKIHLLICILAAASVTAACIIWQEAVFWWLLWVSGVIVVFYFIGHIVRSYLMNQVFFTEEGVAEHVAMAPVAMVQDETIPSEDTELMDPYPEADQGLESRFIDDADAEIDIADDDIMADIDDLEPVYSDIEGDL